MDYGQSEHNLFVKSLQSRVAQSDWPDLRHAVYAAFLLQREITVLCIDFSLAAQAYGCPRIWKFNPDARRGAGLVKVNNHFDAIISDTFVQTPPPVQSVPSQSRAPSAPPVAPQQQLGYAERAGQIYSDWVKYFSGGEARAASAPKTKEGLDAERKAEARAEREALTKRRQKAEERREREREAREAAQQIERDFEAAVDLHANLNS